MGSSQSCSPGYGQSCSRSFGSELYSDAASLGKIIATISLVLFSILFFILLIAGIVMVTSKNVYTGHVTATVLDHSVCNFYTSGANNVDKSYYCTLQLGYTVNGTRYQQPLVVDVDKNYKTGDTIKIDWNEAKNDPTDIQLSGRLTRREGGVALIITAILGELLVILFYWLTHRSKLFAAAEGGVAVVNLFR